MNSKIGWIVVVLSLSLITAGGSGQEKDERDSLNELRQTLRKRFESLEKEQDFLMFQKAMNSSDSKYLLLNVSTKDGQLKYKNRVLKNFRLVLPNKYPLHSFPTGMLALSAKKEEKNGKHALRFGDALILQWKRSPVPPQDAGIPFLSLTKQNLQSVFYALEPGARAYVRR